MTTSSEGTPISHAIGAKIHPKIWSRLSVVWKRVSPIQPRPTLTIATSAVNAISMAPTFRASLSPSVVPAARALEEVHVGLGHFDLREPHRLGLVRLGHHDLGDHDRSGRRHHAAGDEVAGHVRDVVLEEAHVRGEDAPAVDARDHAGEELGLRQPRDVRPDRERGLGLADEDVRDRREALRRPKSQEHASSPGRGPSRSTA